MKEDLESVLDSDSVEGHIVIPFAQRPEMCSDVASECAAHCKSVGTLILNFLSLLFIIHDLMK